MFSASIKDNFKSAIEAKALSAESPAAFVAATRSRASSSSAVVANSLAFFLATSSSIKRATMEL